MDFVAFTFERWSTREFLMRDRTQNIYPLELELATFSQKMWDT